MPHYIYLTFAFMAVVLYEMSGGTDFEPGTTTTASVLSFASPETPVAPVALRNDSADTANVLPAVARESELDSALPSNGADAEAQVTLASLETPTVARSMRDPVSARMQGQSATGQAGSGIPTATPEKVERDLRQVDASRVNLRTGPGLNYEVVTQLGEGQAVEVLQDTGDGWLNLRVVGSDRQGWMADFLVAAAVD